MALKTNLVGVWCESANPWDDQHTNGLTLTDNNTVGNAAGKVGTAGDFEASSSESLSHAHDALFNPGTGTMSISFWMRAESSTTAGTYIISHQKTTASYNGYGIFLGYFGNAGGLAWEGFDGSGTTQVFSTSTTNDDGNWHHVVVTRNGTSINIYVDGTEGHSGTGYGGDYDFSAEFVIGAFADKTSQCFDGLINQLALWIGRELSSSDVAEIYNSGNGLAFSSWDAGGGFDPSTGFGYVTQTPMYRSKTEVIAY